MGVVTVSLQANVVVLRVMVLLDFMAQPAVELTWTRHRDTNHTVCVPFRTRPFQRSSTMTAFR